MTDLEEYVDRIRNEYAKQLVNEFSYAIGKEQLSDNVFKLVCTWINLDWDVAERHKHCIYFSPYLVVREEYKNGKIVNIEKRFR